MTSIEYWQKLVAEYPSLASDKKKITLEVSWLHTKMTLAHAEGCKYTKERQKEGPDSFPAILLDAIRRGQNMRRGK